MKLHELRLQFLNERPKINVVDVLRVRFHYRDLQAGLFLPSLQKAGWPDDTHAKAIMNQYSRTLLFEVTAGERAFTFEVDAIALDNDMWELTIPMYPDSPVP